MRTLSLAILLSLSLSSGALAQPIEPSGRAGDENIMVTTLSHPNTNVRWGRATGVVEAPLSDVVRMVEDYARYHTFLPHFRTSKVLTQRGNQAIVYMEATVAMDTITLWAQVKMSPLSGDGKTRVIVAKMMKGNVNLLEARWELTPVNEQSTNVAFQLLIDPKVPLPASMLSKENVKASRRAIRALRETLESRPKSTTASVQRRDAAKAN